MFNLIKIKDFNWVDIKGPTESDIKWLKENFKLHPLVLKEMLPPLDYPKCEQFGDYLFLVFFYPFYDAKTFRTIPLELDIVVADDYIITNHYKDIVPLKAIFDKCNLYEEIRDDYTKDGAIELLYRIINEVLQASLPKLSHLRQKIEEIEQDIYANQYHESVEEISRVRRDIIGFQRIIEPQGLVLDTLYQKVKTIFNPEILPYFRHLINLHNQVSTILANQTKILDALDSTNQSLLNTKTNEIIKVLTIFSVIVFPLTFFANLFGMNMEKMPFIGSRFGFWTVGFLMVLGASLTAIYFRRKKWL